MILSVQDLILLLRDSVNVKVENTEGDLVTDPYYTVMSDEDILRYVKLGVNRIYPDVTDMDNLPSNCSEYAIVLLAKIELYTKLAVLRVDKVDLGAESAYIKNSQRFDHYMKLIAEAKEQYNVWLDNEGNDTVNTYELLNSKYSHTRRYYQNQLTPSVSIKVANVLSDSIDIEWSAVNISHFGKCSVYVSKDPIYSKYEDGGIFEDHLLKSKSLKLIKETYDVRNFVKHIKDLESDTTYYILVVAFCRNGVYGYQEITVTTKKEITDGEEIDV